MTTLEFKEIDMQELTLAEMIETSGGGEVWHYTGGNELTYAFTAVHNAYVLIKDWITGEKTTAVRIDDTGRRTPIK